MSDHGVKGIVQLPREVAARIRQRCVRYFARGTQLLFVFVSVLRGSDDALRWRSHNRNVEREREKERERQTDKETERERQREI